MVRQTNEQWKTLCVESPPLKQMILKALFYPKIKLCIIAFAKVRISLELAEFVISFSLSS